MKKLYIYLLTTLVLIVVSLWIATYPALTLKVIACNVGQGDAILITKGRTQILVDGGANNRVLDCLGKYVPFWDRTIEIAIVTHPDKDHYFGLIETLRRYDVGILIANGVDTESSDYVEFKKLADLEGSQILEPQKDLYISANGIILDFAWPDLPLFDQSGASTASDTGAAVLGAYTSNTPLNHFSAVFKLTYGNFDALFTGDVVPAITDELLATGEISDVEYLKVPHHGSKNGLTKELLAASTPEVSVISVGRNSYGHPHQEVIKLIKDEGIKLLRTDEEGDIIVESDGKDYWLR